MKTNWANQETGFSPVMQQFIILHLVSYYIIKIHFQLEMVNFHALIQRGEDGVRTPPGKSQVLKVSIGISKLDPP